MKMKFIILSTIVCIFVACSNPEGEAEIAKLTAKNAELIQQVQTLQKTLDSISVQAETQRKVLEDLDMAK